ncbi:response regulator [Caulobacter sp. KR2-114]|uniref:response regulator n=1 Tax=Caulobacter sp. KR2-114 TaxID=3400912 RepID=UPI003C10479C
MARRVLVVEDEAMVAILIEDLLADLGCELAGSAANAREAMSMAASGEFDVALLDVNLGEGETSFDVADLLRRNGARFAFLTGYGAAGVRLDLRDAPILGKPVDAADLKRFLEAVD